MPIPVRCACGNAFRVPDHLAGKRVRCPKCAHPVPVPVAAPAPVGPVAFRPVAPPALSAPKAPPPDEPAVAGPTAVPSFEELKVPRRLRAEIEKLAADEPIVWM